MDEIAKTNANKIRNSGFRTVSFIKGDDFVNIDIQNGTNSSNGQRTTARSPLDTDLLLAGILVAEARKGGNGYFQTTHRELELYKLYNKPILQFIIYVFVWVNLSLALFEEPAVKGLAIPYWGCLIIEYFCLFVFCVRLFHVWSFAAGVKFWRDKKNAILLVVIVLTFLDMIMYVIFKEAEVDAHTIRWTRIFRPLYLINISEGRQIRRAVRNIRRTLPEIANVLILLLLMIALFALLGVKLFGGKNLKDVHGKPYFTDYLYVYFSLYVLTTTANNPDIGMPAYDYSEWSAWFFVVYLVLCMYIFVSIFLAVVYKNYRKHLKNEVRKSVYRKRRQLKEAFDLLKESRDGKWHVTEKRFLELMKDVCPGWSDAKLALMWQVLDDTGEGVIGKKNFLMLSDLLNVEVLEVKDQVHMLERLAPRLYLSKASNFVKKCVLHRFFVYFFDLVIFANAIFIALDANDYEILFLVLFNIEILLKFYTIGFKDFFRGFWNWFDFLVIGAATLALVIEASFISLQSSQSVLDFLMVLRVLRLAKIIGQVRRFQVIIGTLMQIGPAITTYGAIMFILYYIYAIVGIELFGGLILKEAPTNDNSTVNSTFCGNIKLKGSDFYQDRYCSNNFDDILKAMKLLFDLTVVNQWHVITQGFVLVTNKWARLYFLSFHMICVIVVLNIFVAFILEAFMLEYSISHGKFETVIEKKIEEKGIGVSSEVNLIRTQSTVESLAFKSGLRFRLPKQQKKNAETFLQQMFEGELEENDFGPRTDDLDDLDDLEDEQEARREIRLKFSSID
ncbi:two pore calcium channel protein 1 isoform X3 [Nematostella vectensis]|uniref:two pore calcium channel protein 1 isoform X3 n=1 Tax=Nematostella vectensis TaxID=45351 RepID=UPI002077783C|nr:two pore calcium channel protein 1 isoform X3 [Nematostella vectensis]